MDAQLKTLIELQGVEAAAAYAALTTGEGITGWWTSRADVPGTRTGDVLKMSFPDAPMTWDMRVDRSDRRAGSSGTASAVRPVGKARGSRGTSSRPESRR